MRILHQEQAYAAKLHQLAAAARKCPRPEVRQLWNPKRPWSVDRYGGRVADPKTIQCRAAIKSTLKRCGPLSANQIYVQTPGFGDRRQRNAKDWLVTAGEIVPLKEDRKITRYTLPEDQDHA